MKQIQEDHLKQMDEINTMLAEKQKEEVFILICIYKLSVINPDELEIQCTDRILGDLLESVSFFLYFLQRMSVVLYNLHVQPTNKGTLL
jgi:hypothetical protein